MASSIRSTPSSAGRRGLTDDVITLEPRERTIRGYLRDGVDHLAGADPELTQLRLALQSVLGLVVSLGLAYAFVRMTDALRMPAAAGAPAAAHAANHALLIVALLPTGTVALMVGAAINDTTKRTQILYTLLLPAPLLASMSIGLALGPYRIASLIWLVVLLAMAVYLRRFGPRGVTIGLVVFNGGFLGFFLHAQIGLRNIDWIAALLGIGVISSLVVHYALFRKSPTATLERMRRSWEARADRLLDLSIDVLDASDPQHLRSASRRLAQQLVRINESTLMSDAQLVESIPTSAAVEAQRLFNADLALSNIARFADALAGQCRDGPLRAKARAVIAAVLAGDKHDVDARAGDLRRARCDDTRMNVVALRLAASAETYLAARRRIGAAIESAGDKAPEPYEPAVTLSSGYLPGSGPVSTEASTTPGRGGAFDRVVLQPHVRAAIQVAVAGTIAIVVGDIVSGPRLYWAVLTTFLAFLSTTNSGEQVRKAVFRVLGTGSAL